MKVYTPDIDYKLQKIATAAKLFSKQIKVEKIGFDAKISKNFKENYPQHSLPALQTNSGKFFFGVNTILLYLSAPAKQELNRSQILEYLQKIQKNIDPATGMFYLNRKKAGLFDESQLKKSKDILLGFCKQLNEKLILSTYLVGQNITIADISCYFNIRELLQSEQAEVQKQKQKMKCLKRWFDQLTAILSQ